MMSSLVPGLSFCSVKLPSEAVVTDKNNKISIVNSEPSWRRRPNTCVYSMADTGIRRTLKREKSWDVIRKSQLGRNLKSCTKPMSQLRLIWVFYTKSAKLSSLSGTKSKESRGNEPHLPREKNCLWEKDLARDLCIFFHVAFALLSLSKKWDF